MSKQKILSILDELSNYDLSNMYYSLTLNYKKIVNDYNYVKFNITDVKNIINNYNENIDTFNLSFNNIGDYDENRYKLYYYNTRLIFYSDGIVFNFSSQYLTNERIEVSDIKTLFFVYEQHKNFSKILYDTIVK